MTTLGGRIGVCALALSLAGCGSTGLGLGARAAQHVRGDADGAVISGMDSRAEAYPLAIAHCARFGRSAQFAGRAPGGRRFRCVPG